MAKSCFIKGKMRVSRYLPLAIVASCVLATNVFAQTGRVKDNHIGCVTKNYLDQMTNALVNKDRRLFDTLIGEVCVPIQGREFSILDRGFVTSKIRVYVGSDHVDLHVPSEATR